MTTAATGAAAGGAVAATTTEQAADSVGAHSQPAPRSEASARRKPSSLGVFAGSLAAFFALLAFLAVQVRAGGDPALGPAKPAPTAEPRRVIVHRVIVRKVIVTERPRVAAGGGQVATSGGGTAVAGGGSSAPAPSAPAPAPAPAAPVTTGSS
jgi:hypothetical protein